MLRRTISSFYLASAAALICVSSPANAHAAAFTVIYTFGTGSQDGGIPYDGLIEDDAGNLYGTTQVGGAYTCTGAGYLGCGTVFELAPNGTETILHSFAGPSKTGATDGFDPQAALIMDDDGNLYGTTTFGGDEACKRSHQDGCGTVFRLAPDGTETIIYSFTGKKDGFGPGASLTMDSSGNLYGTTGAGGGRGCGVDHFGCGTAFEISPNGTETLLHAFTGKSDGAFPSSNLIPDHAGNLYGTTKQGGENNKGTVFKLTPDGQESILYSFRGGSDGRFPQAGLIMDQAGNLYGTTGFSGMRENCSSGCGTIFKINPDGDETVLYAFKGGSDGAVPSAGLTADSKGNLFGTTVYGGGGTCDAGCGTVFELAKGKTEKVLYAFAGGSGGYYPVGGVTLDANGNIFGTTSLGGTTYGCGGGGCGIVFRLTK